ncbi:MAG: PAS domain-containing protein, partial [Treponema sp.]|nr:PAS domain-containing protein [Treponema sp.]
MPVKRLLIKSKVWVKRPLYTQVLYVVLAFALMVIASTWFVSGIERKHLQRDVKNAILFTEANIKADMLEPETILAGIAETIRNMILTGSDAETVREYIRVINNYMQGNEEKRLLGINGFYGFFDVFGGFITGERIWLPPEDYELQARPWYIAAVEAGGDISSTQPYFNLATEETTITFARRIFDEAGDPLGIVCLNIFPDRIKQHAVNTQFAEKGYGFLLNQDMELIAHPEPSMLGMHLRNIRSYIATYEDELGEKGYIYEIVTTDYRGIKSIVFIEKLYNGWYMGVVTPREKFYQSRRNMALFLAALGTLLAAILITILTRISAEKNKADERMRIMFNAMPLGANIHNKNFDYFDCNDGAVRMFGLSGKREFRERFFELWPEYQPNGELSSKIMAQADEKAFTYGYCRFEWTYQNLKGELIPGECTLVRVKHNNEFVLVAYMRDLRELKLMMKEVEHQQHLLNTVNSVAGVLLSINDEKSFEASLLRSFELVGHCLDADRVQIWRNEVIGGELHFVNIYQWLSGCGSNSVAVPIGSCFSYSSRPEWESLFLRGEYINTPVSGMPESDRIFLTTYALKSVVVIPMFLEGNFWGLFSIEDCRRERAFSNEEIHILTSAGLMMSNAVKRGIQTAKMHEADERTRLMVDAMPLCANFWDKNDNIIDCNQEAVKMFGLSGKEEYKDRFLELSPEYQPDGRSSKDMGYEFITKAFEEGYSRCEWMHQKPDGEPIPCEVTFVRVEYKNDFIVVAYARDLRELKTMLDEIREADERVQIMFDATPLGANFFDYEGRIIDCNNEAVRLFDMPNKQEYLKNFNDLMPE